MDIKIRIENLSKRKRQLLIERAKQYLHHSRLSVEKPISDFKKQTVQDPSVTESNLGAKRRLVAYLVKNQGQDVTAKALRTFLQARLPYYMVPSNFFFLETIPLMPNGKIDRKALSGIAREAGAGGSEKTYTAPRNTTEEALVKIWTEVLGVEKIGVFDNFFELGGDSILSIQIISKARQNGLKLTANQLFQNQTIAELAPIVDTSSLPQSEQGLVLGPVQLTPIQNWFLQQNLPEPYHWNQAGIFKAKPEVSYEIVYQAISFLIRHHDALRLSFIQDAGVWYQTIVDVPSTPPIKRIDLSGYDITTQRLLITEKASEEQTNLDLSKGRIFQAIFFDCGEVQANRLLLIVHHLAIDGISWQVLIEDLEGVCSQLVQGKPITLPNKTTSFKSWSDQIHAFAQNDEIKKELDFWVVDEHKQVDPLPVDFKANNYSNTVTSIAKECLMLTKQETETLLHEVPSAYHTKINDILLTALIKACFNWTGKNWLLLGLEGHGREEINENIDLSRTIGWFTSYFPVFLKLKNPSDPGKSIIEVKEHLRKIPNHGLGFGILRYCCRDEKVQKKMKALTEPQLCFNYLGNIDSNIVPSNLFETSEESSGTARSPKGTRPYLLEFNAFVRNEQFYIDCSYSRNFHQKTTIQTLVSFYIANLRELITHCQSPTAGGYSPSDFPESGLDQDELDRFISNITR